MWIVVGRAPSGVRPCVTASRGVNAASAEPANARAMNAPARTSDSLSIRIPFFRLVPGLLPGDRFGKHGERERRAPDRKTRLRWDVVEVDEVAVVLRGRLRRERDTEARVRRNRRDFVLQRDVERLRCRA